MTVPVGKCRRVRAAKKLGKVTVPCKVRHYHDRLEELRALMGTNLHRRFRKRFSEGLSIRKAADAMQQNRGVVERRQAALYRAFAQLLHQGTRQMVSVG